MDWFFVLLAGLVVAMLLTAALFYRGGRWLDLWTVFSVILLFALAGATWTAPYGPAYGGLPWFGIVFWAVLIALLVAAFPGRRPRRGADATSGKERESALAVGGAFWVLIPLLLAAVLWGAFRT